MMTNKNLQCKMTEKPFRKENVESKLFVSNIIKLNLNYFKTFSYRKSKMNMPQLDRMTLNTFFN